MINKQIQYTVRGANQDITKSKHQQEFYFDAEHIRVTATDGQSTGSVTNEKGNKLKVSLPTINIDNINKIISYGNKTIKYENDEINNEIDDRFLNKTITDHTLIGNSVTRDSLILFTTSKGGDVIWKVSNILEEDGDYPIDILYIRNLDFSEEHPIQTLFNYENSNIQKVYWVDGKNQFRFININHSQIEGNSEVIDIRKTNLNFVGKVEFSQPIIEDVIPGGSHSSGMIQYAYNLYNLNGSQTKISPLSDLIPLDKGGNSGGGEVNEIVGTTPKVKINKLDPNYTHIKIYSIKYTSYGQLPSVSLINESEIDSTDFTYYDSGSVIDKLSISEFLFLGSDPSIPKHIESKDNRLLISNIKTKNFLIPDELDTRAYSFPKSSTTTQVLDKVDSVSSTGKAQGNLRTIDSSFELEETHSSINPNYDVNKYVYNSIKRGGEGKYLRYEFDQQNIEDLDKKTDKFFKNKEIYRIGIKFYNNLGQTSLPKWIADFKSDSDNLSGNPDSLKVILKPEFFIWLNNYQFESESDKPIGFKIIRASREEKDKTILVQGMLNSMMYQVKGNPSDFSAFVRSQYDNRRLFQDTSIKFPTYITRTFRPFPDTDEYNGTAQEKLGKNKHAYFISAVNDNDLENQSSEEANTDEQASSFIHTAMMQMFSPEILFDKSLRFSNGLQISINGLLKNTKNGIWAKEIYANSNNDKYAGKTEGVINPWFQNESEYIDNNGFRNTFNTGGIDTGIPHAYIAATGDNETFNTRHWFRQYNEYYKNNNNNSYDIYGSPEITERGQGDSLYNDDGKFKYKNNLRGYLVGGGRASILDIQSEICKNATIVLGNNKDTKTHLRNKLEDLLDSTSSDMNQPEKSVLLAEIKRDSNYVYFGNIYNGNSYEQKKRTTYVEIGDYTSLENNFVLIKNPGDTFVQNFKFLRVGRTAEDSAVDQSLILSEVVEFPVETQINLINRNDSSLSSWDSTFLPKDQDYHKYNKVYSQASNLIKDNDIDFTFRRIEDFDTRIQASKLKIPNESIDSWTDLLPNEILDLDGKHGPINSINTFQDKLYAFQDKGIAAIAVNPRIQIQADDGVGIELGKGNVLYDHQYLTTSSGAVNKWGVQAGKRGIYYYDLLNKGIGRVPDASGVLLSDSKGFHSWFNNNYDYDILKEDNPILSQGAVTGVDHYNNDVFFTLHQGDKTFTRVFNELTDLFIDRKYYSPYMYINKGSKLFANDGSDIYEQYIGEYNKFFNKYIPSTLTLVVNPNANQSNVFNNIFYNSEVYLSDIDQPDKTLTHIQAYNEYQDSGKIPLVVGRNKNLRRKFREWKANIPRDKRNRMRNPWIFLKVYFENENDYKLILHDIIVSYTL